MRPLPLFLFFLSLFSLLSSPFPSLFCLFSFSLFLFISIFLSVFVQSISCTHPVPSFRQLPKRWDRRIYRQDRSSIIKNLFSTCLTLSTSSLTHGPAFPWVFVENSSLFYLLLFSFFILLSFPTPLLQSLRFFFSLLVPVSRQPPDCTFW